MAANQGRQWVLDADIVLPSHALSHLAAEIERFLREEGR